MRRKLLYKLDELFEICKKCEKNVGSEGPEKRCKGCQTYTEIRWIGDNLGRKKDMAKITMDEYQALNAQGLSDKEIAFSKEVNAQYLSQLKKKWNIRPVSVTTSEKKPSETNTTQEDKTTQELNEKIAKLVHDYESKIEELNCACEDVENELVSLREEKKKLQADYQNQVEQNYHNSYHVENQKNVIKNLNKTLERYENENKALRELVKLWM